MSLSEVSTGVKAVLFTIQGSSSLRLRTAIVIALVFCVLVTPIVGKESQVSCGKRQPQIASRVLNGAITTLERWPWHAAVYRYQQLRNAPTYACGGSIIGIDTILTVAHCFVSGSRLVGVDQITVFVGLENLKEMTDHQAFNVSRLITHPEFDISNVANDIAILKLSSDIRMTRSVQPVCLWSMNDDINQIVGKTGTVVGFGKTEYEQPTGTLQEVPLTVVDFWTCLDNDRATFSRVLTRNMYCAGGTQGSSPCNGDNGGGMFFAIDGTWYVRGVVSFMVKRSNEDSCDPNKYAVFTDVSKYRDWVLQSTNTSNHLTRLKLLSKLVAGRN